MNRIFAFVPAAAVADANTKAKVDFDAHGGEYTFGVPLSPTGKAPATHYACSTCADAEGFSGLRKVLAETPGSDYHTLSGGFTWSQALSRMGLKVVQEDIQASG